MKGTIYKLSTKGVLSIYGTYSNVSAPLEAYQAVVGGYIELVYGFDKFKIDGQTVPCVVFCNEEGKLYELPPNAAATRAWFKALPIIDDFLVGDVAIVTGDQEFMDAV